MDLAARIDTVLDDPALGGTAWSVEVRRVGEPRPAYARDAKRLLRTASLGKLFLLVEVADRIHRGDLDPSEPLDRFRGLPVADSGLWQHLEVDRLPLADVTRLVGAVSDNLATNVLLDRVGLDAVQARARDLAPGGSMLHDLVRDRREPSDPPTLSEGCARDFAHLLEGLAAGTVVAPAVAALVLGWLAPGTDLSMVGAAFDLDPLAHAEPDLGVLLVSKTGTNAEVRADVGLVEAAGERWVYAVICNGEMGDPGHRRAALGALRAVGQALRDA